MFPCIECKLEASAIKFSCIFVKAKEISVSKQNIQKKKRNNLIELFCIQVNVSSYLF